MHVQGGGRGTSVYTSMISHHAEPQRCSGACMLQPGMTDAFFHTAAVLIVASEFDRISIVSVDPNHAFQQN